MRISVHLRLFALLTREGDSFTIGPTAINTFRNWPTLLRRNEDIAYDPLLAYHKHTGERIAGPMEVSALVSKDIQESSKPERIYRHQRPKFHSMLLEQLASIGVQVEYGKEFVEHFEAADGGQAGIVLADNSRHEADLVVAADGVRGHV